MMIRRYHLLLLLALSATTENANAFTIPSRPFGTRRVTASKTKQPTTTTLLAGFATDGYLNSLTELARTSSAYTTEDYLNSLARLGDDAYRTSSSSSSSFDQNGFNFGSTFNVADASSVVEETANTVSTANNWFDSGTATSTTQVAYDPSTTQVAYDPLTTSNFAASAREASEIAANAKASMDEVADKLTDFSTATASVTAAQENIGANSGPMESSAAEVVNNAVTNIAAAPSNTMASTTPAGESAGESVIQNVAMNVASTPSDAVQATNAVEQTTAQVGNAVSSMAAANPVEQTTAQVENAMNSMAAANAVEQTAVQVANPMNAMPATNAVEQTANQAGNAMNSMMPATATSSMEQAVAQVGTAVSEAASRVDNSFSTPQTADPLGLSSNSAVEKATEIAASASASMNEVGAKLTEGLASVNNDISSSTSSSQVNDLIGHVAGASGSLVGKSSDTLMAAEQMLTNMEGNVYGSATGALDNAELALTNMENNVANHVVSALEATETQLTDMENNVLGTIDQMLRSVTGSQYDNVVRVLESAKASITGVISGALQSITDTIGQITFTKMAHFGEGVFAGLQDGYNVLEQIVKTLVALDIAIVKLLFQVVSFVVQAVSGKTIPEWTMAADGIVNQEAGKLSAQASATAADLSDKSVSELVMSMGMFLQNMSNLMSESVGAVFGAVESVTAPLAGSMASSSVGSVSEMVSSAMTNL